MGRSQLKFEDAVRILARGDTRINKLDKLLGGTILGAAPFTFGVSLALLDAKSEAIGLLRELTDTAPARIKAAKGKTHYELLTAAHSVLVTSSFFDAFREAIGPRSRELKLDDDKVAAPIGFPPMPSSTRGFAENLVAVRAHIVVLCLWWLEHVASLAAWERVGRSNSVQLRKDVVAKACDYYRDRFIRLAVDLPEFGFWVSLDEHAATQGALRELHDLLASTVKAAGQMGDVEGKLARRAADVLERPLWRMDTPLRGISFPDVASGFVSPRFRLAVADKDSKAADESWWEQQPVADDLGNFLTQHLAHPESTRRPLVILGHPGAGKTMMAEVLAARLPAEGYTPIVVRLRRVDADAQLHRQIESALESTVREQVSWGQLCRESKSTKVVIFDGFDELVQATGVTQSGYLEEIAAFQEEAWRDGHAVIPIVTSRTLVMDRARIPDGCLLIKLEDFDEAQVDCWVEAWNAANKAIPGFRPLTGDELLRHGELGRQPLLITLLAIYAAETGIERLDAHELSRSELYRRLLDSFVARQVRDKAPHELSEVDRDKRETLLRRDLAVAAFAMFNRGQQFITEADLDKDLGVLSPGGKGLEQKNFGQPMSRAQRTIAAFFFVHVAQADENDTDRARRTFEFLHATFGEYLVAEYSVQLLREIVEERERRRAKVFSGRLDESVFRALLSHQPLLKRRPVVDFVSDMLAEPERTALKETCLELLATSRDRGTVDGIEAYEPTPFDAVTRLAAYTANLVTLACLAGSEGLEMSELSRGASWESTVRLWRAGLDAEGQESVFGPLHLAPDGTVALINDDSSTPYAVEVHTAQLVGDLATELHLRSGRATWPAGEDPSDLTQVGIHSGVVALMASRRPLPTLGRLTLYDERDYRGVAGMIKQGGMAPITGYLLLKLLIDDGPQLPQGLVSRLHKAIDQSWHPANDQIYPALLVCCPFLLDEKPELLHGKSTALGAFLLRQGLERIPERHRERADAIATMFEESLTGVEFRSASVTMEMVEWAWQGELSYRAVHGLLTAIDKYGAKVWEQVDPRHMRELARKVGLSFEPYMERFRKAHPELLDPS